MKYLKHLTFQINEIFAGDRQLAAEVAFDIRQLEERGAPMRKSIAPTVTEDDLESEQPSTARESLTEQPSNSTSTPNT
jgi:hypothetical protein